jgi:[pyruvate, water dikinase]-phosphate phosphotransferase / [pyruvate, water dikinase] kinase
MNEPENQDKKTGRLPRQFHLHLVSDATGTTLLGLARACIAQFEDVEPVQKFWPLVRTQRQLDRIITRIEENPGPVIFTLVDEKMRKRLQERCDELHIPCVAVLDPIIRSLSSYLGKHAKGVPGLQHQMDDAYFRRVSAIDFAMRHDDGKKLSDLNEADVILVGVSRTSKTPTSVFLARRGIKAANIPLVPGVEVPPEKFELKNPMYVGLTASPDRLILIRRSRLKADTPEGRQYDENEYLDQEKIEEEVRSARRLFSKHGWPVIDVTKRSIEETAAEIMALLQSYREEAQGAAPEGGSSYE